MSELEKKGTRIRQANDHKGKNWQRVVISKNMPGGSVVGLVEKKEFDRFLSESNGT